ncbi:MAG: TonB-dependent receptor [Bacteroidia bacterium]|nr:TonB-dependent receptor [Bacteroidia bacterium]
MIGELRKRILALLVLTFVSSAFIFAQKGTVSGKVKDENGDPLVGTTVMVEGTQMGTLTDGEGNYSIQLDPGDYNLVFSFVGYDKQTKSVKVAAGETISLNTGMELEGKEMDDVVIVGYGTQRKRDLTGSISKIGARDLNDIPGTSFEATLQGKAPGVQVIQSSGIAGAGAMVRVRGIASVGAGGDPLYVVDGIPITQDNFANGDRGGQNNNPLSSINPNDIESIEILKDAAATGIYGSRGSNGVILITTKRGKRGKPTFDFSTRIGLSQPTKLQSLLTGDQWLQLRQEAWENDGNTGRAPLPMGLTLEDAQGVNTDWQDKMVQTGVKQEYNFSMRQGNDKIKTYLGVSAMNSESYIVGNSYQRLTARGNVDWNILKNLRVSGNFSLARGLNNRVDQAWAGGLGAAQSTLLPIYSDTLNNQINPLFKQTVVDWQTLEYRTINNISLFYEPIKGLEINASGNFDYMDMGDDILEDSLWDTQNHTARAKEWATNVFNWSTNGYASYKVNLPEDHGLKIMAGMEAQKSVSRSEYLELTNVYKPIYANPSASENTDTINTVNPTERWSFVSLFTRVNYDYKKKYFFQATARIDGSSKFGRENVYGFFPTVGGGYILSEESWWKEKVPVINFLKFKASWGKTGNANIPNNARFGLFSSNQNNVTYNGDSTIYPTQLENPFLQWETAYTVDGGFEIGFWNDRLTADVTFYNKKTRDMLIQLKTATSTGFPNYWSNVGQVLNRGFEIGITSRNLVGKFKWTTTLNLSRNYNKVLDVGDTAPDALAGSGDTRVIEGQPLGVNYLVRFSHVDAATGLPVWLDKDGNETMTWSENNRVVVGKVLPDVIGGLTNRFEYKGFDLEALWTFSIGGNIYDDAAKRQLGVFTDWNMRTDIINRWTTPGQEGATYPRLTMNPGTYGGLGSEWNLNTTQFLYDATYYRLKKVSLGYSFNGDLVTKMHLQALRLYVTGTNLITITNYPGSDPEVVRDQNGPQGRNISPNVSYLTPPQERTLSVGLNVTF